jgi:hypothetical protein
MNATSYSEFRTEQGPGGQDDRLDQVRDLLFGEYHRQSEARLAMMEARIRELELALQHRLDTLEARAEQLVSKAGADQRAAFDDLAHGIADLGDRIRRMR